MSIQNDDRYPILTNLIDDLMNLRNGYVGALKENVNGEIIAARKGYDLLGYRLDDIDSQLAEKASQSEVSEEFSQVNSQLAEKASQSEVSEEFSQVNSQLADNANKFGILSNKTDTWIDVKVDFGAKGNGVTNDTQAIQNAINFAYSAGGGTVYIPPGTYYITSSILLKNNVTVIGAGIDVTVIDLKGNTNVIAFETPTPTITTLTQTNNIKVGDTINTINNNVQPGDFVVYKNTARFTAEWDGGSEIRPYYKKAEILKVLSATPTSITFTEGASLSLPVATTNGVDTFTPNRNIRIGRMTIRRNRDTTSYSVSIHIRYTDGAGIFEIKSINTNDKGVCIDRSRHVTVQDYFCEGGTPNLGLNYGVAVVDGSKHVYLKNIHTKNCRHGIAGGGTGYAVPIGVVANGIFITSSQGHSLDTHGNCMNFMYMNGKVDNGISMSGIGHTAQNIVSSGGPCQINEGGTDIVYENLTFLTCSRFYSNNCVMRVLFKNVKLNFLNFTVNALRVGSNNVTFEDCRFVNMSFVNAANSNATADATLPDDGVSHCGIMLRDCYRVKRCFIQGFAIGFYVNGAECSVEDVTLENCGWDSAHTHFNCAFQVSLNGERSFINNIKIAFYKSGLDNDGRIIRMDANGAGTGKQITISNVKYAKNHVKDYYYGMYAVSNFTEIFLYNIRATFRGTSDVSCTGKFIYNTVVADN